MDALFIHLFFFRSPGICIGAFNFVVERRRRCRRKHFHSILVSYGLLLARGIAAASFAETFRPFFSPRAQSLPERRGRHAPFLRLDEHPPPTADADLAAPLGNMHGADAIAPPVGGHIHRQSDGFSVGVGIRISAPPVLVVRHLDQVVERQSKGTPNPVPVPVRRRRGRRRDGVPNDARPAPRHVIPEKREGGGRTVQDIDGVVVVRRTTTATRGKGPQSAHVVRQGEEGAGEGRGGSRTDATAAGGAGRVRGLGE
mmetsp:Transcript_12241/g.35929  ORF Transcript_12241/g.35929 Transcript_12241/m.35929 type:complete len:256 (-) Transcript_12241:129-896(-)